MSKPEKVQIRNSTAEFLQNIFAAGDRDEKAVCRNFRHTAEDGKEYPTAFYNLDAFLQFNQRDLLDHPGKVTSEIAKAFAESEFEKYRIVQDRLFESDFDRIIKQLPNAGEQP
jgi:hypothetical protein